MQRDLKKPAVNQIVRIKSTKMQYIHKKSKNIGYQALSIIFFLLVIISSNAQPDACQNLLETHNRKPLFPEENEADYLRCLATIETEYRKSVQKKSEIGKEIDKWNTDLRKKNTELERARQNNDTINVNKFTLDADQITKGLNTAKEKLDTNAAQISAYKNLLSSSYNRMVDYFEKQKENSAQAKIYNDKLVTLNRSN